MTGMVERRDRGGVMSDARGRRGEQGIHHDGARDGAAGSTQRAMLTKETTQSTGENEIGAEI
jgi:hypothetical protein